MNTIIYVVGFSPRDDGIGGFDWYRHPTGAQVRVIEHMTNDPTFECDYIARAVKLPQDAMQSQSITEWLDTEGRHLWDTPNPVTP